MPWLIGIDEAGYGPNLGPFVMSATLFQVPDGQGHNLWKPLRPAVRALHPKAKGGPILNLPSGWEPCWTYHEMQGRAEGSRP